jgi:hypothetical protein
MAPLFERKYCSTNANANKYMASLPFGYWNSLARIIHDASTAAGV